jgi:hypothetical protein
LRQSVGNEDALISKPDKVLHRTITFEERKSPGGELVASRRIEVWQSADRGIVARRLYNELNQLVAGEWRRSDGVQTLYHHGAPPRIQLTPDNRAARSLDASNLWQLSPSAKDFIAITSGSDNARVEESPNSYTISVESGKSVVLADFAKSGYVSVERVSSLELVKASLVLNKSDLHATVLVLVLRENNGVTTGSGSNQNLQSEGSSLREFRFVETAFDQRAAADVAPIVFEPEPELLSTIKSGLPKSIRGVGLPPTGAGRLTPVFATPALEVEVLRLLNQAGADMGEQITVTR